MEYQPYYETTIDPRLSYLTWKYGYDFYVANHASGNAIAAMAATQALVWAWHSDPETGSSVFANVAGGLDDPFNWDGLTPSLHTDTSPRVGFHGDDLGATYWTGTDEELLQAATQAVYDLAVEATAKAGPWTLSQGVGATGVVLTGANGPIEGEVINFQDGTTDGIDVITNVNGYAAWPNGTTAAHAEGPGQSYETQGDSDQGEEGQNIVLTLGEQLVVNVDDPAPTTTTTTSTTTTLPQSDNETPTTTTTMPEVELTTTTTTAPTTTTTTAPEVTTTTVASLDASTSSTTTTTTAPATTTSVEDVSTTTLDAQGSTSSIANPPILPSTGTNSNIFPALLLLATGCIGVLAGRRRRLG
jgi:LPXTG-motif cell wall-anchored protein